MQTNSDAALISIIIPVYNKEKYLASCLESVVRQTYSDIEIVLIDDGSTDASGAICDDWAAADSRIKVVHTVNSGVSAARNLGLELATGSFITFVDADDTMTRDAIDTMYRGIVADNLDVWISYLDEDLWRQCAGSYSKYLLNKRKVAIWGCIFRSEIARTACFPEALSNSEDFVYLYLISRVTNNVSGNPVYEQNIYRYNPSVEQSLCKQVSIERVNSTLDSIAIVGSHTPSALTVDFELYAFNMYLYVLSNCPQKKNCPDGSLHVGKKELGKYLRKHFRQWMRCSSRRSNTDVAKALCCSLFPSAYSAIVSAVKGVGNGK